MARKETAITSGSGFRCPAFARIARHALMLALGLILAACGSRGRPEALSLESRLRLSQTLDSKGAGNPAATVALLREAVASRPQDAALREQLAVALDRAGAFSEAAQAMSDAVAIAGPTELRLMAIGRAQLRAGNAAAAAESFAQAARIAPGDPAALDALGLARDLAGDQPGAQEAYRSALARAPQDWSTRANFALSLVISRQAREAADVLADAEYDAAAPVRARHNLALALAATGRSDRAIRLLRVDMGPAEAVSMTQELTAVAARLDPGLTSQTPAGARSGERLAGQAVRSRQVRPR